MNNIFHLLMNIKKLSLTTNKTKKEPEHEILKWIVIIITILWIKLMIRTYFQQHSNKLMPYNLQLYRLQSHINYIMHTVLLFITIVVVILRHQQTTTKIIITMINHVHINNSEFFFYSYSCSYTFDINKNRWKKRKPN